MGYGFYFVWGWEGERPAGYNVLATCDRRGCENEIDRGLAFLCGESPGMYPDGRGCGRYFCGDHLGWVGDRGGCPHRGKRTWGRSLACMKQAPDDTYCLSRAGHDGPCAWALP